MSILKKNIWFIFYILTLTATVLLIIASYLNWQSTYLKYQTSQENVVEIMANATHALFDTQERLIDILGVSILEAQHHLSSPEDIQKHAQSLLQNPDVVAFGVTTPEGDFIYATSNTNPKEIPNIKNQPESHDSFIEALENKGMVFGRTYFSHPLQKWAMPIRKTVRDEQGSPLFVMTTLLKLTSTFDALLNTIRHRENLVVSVLRDTDQYLQYSSLGKDDYNKTYQYPCPKEVIERVYAIILDTYKLSLEELKNREQLVSFGYTHNDGVRYLVSLQYNKTYKLWIISYTYIDTIMQDFLQSFALYFILYTSGGGIFFFLFRLIAHAEARRRDDLIEQATHDQLTGLLNRSYLQTNMGDWIYPNAPSFSIFYIDMDNFKTINDSFGHQCGDYLLIALAKRLKNIIPKNSVIIRHGGDEFVVFSHLNNDDALLELAKNLIDAISQPYNINNLNLSVGASIGISTYPTHGTNIDMLLRAADIAMYESKKIKNRTHIFVDTMQEEYLKNINIEQELRKSIDQNELFMVYQPQINDTGSIYGVEALVRWNSATLGIIPPDQFIPVAETSGQMVKIGRFIIWQTLKEIKEVQTMLSLDFQTSINISVRQFMDVEFLEHFLKTIQETQMHEISITIEITENLFIEDINYILPLLHEMRTLGIQISMDDFGTGYSSLSMLRKLPIDELKIDKSFVDTIFEDEEARKMIQNIIAIGKNFNICVLAEGVETKEQKEILSSFGCDRFQGYYFAKPLPKDELIAFFKKELKV